MIGDNEIKENEEFESIFDVKIDQLPSTKVVKAKQPDEVITCDNESIELPNEDGTPKTPEQLEQTDFEYARKTLRIAIETGKDALENVSSLAEDSEHPRSYEVVGELLSHITNSTRELLNLHKLNKELKKDKDGNGSGNVTNNTLVLTTNELIKMMKNGQK